MSKKTWGVSADFRTDDGKTGRLKIKHRSGEVLARTAERAWQKFLEKAPKHTKFYNQSVALSEEDARKARWEVSGTCAGAPGGDPVPFSAVVKARTPERAWEKFLEKAAPGFAAVTKAVRPAED